MIDAGTFCYRVMPFDLKNTEDTYQRMVTDVFKGLIGSNMEAYMDNILVKNLSFEQYLRDLEEVFEVFKRYQIKLNLAKGIIGMKARKFLGFMVSKNGIKPNPAEAKGINEHKPT